LFLSIRALLTTGCLTTLSEQVKISPAYIAAFAGIGIPLGYVIYQLYYCIYLRFFPFRFVPANRGWVVLKSIPNINPFLKRKVGRTFQQPFEYRIWPNLDKLKMRKWLKETLRILTLLRAETRKISINDTPQDVLEPTMRNISRVYRDNWLLAQIVWFESLEGHPSAKEYLQQDLRTNFDIFHSVGASRWALGVALTFYLVYELAIHGGKAIPTHPEYLIALCINVFISLVLFIAFQHVRSEVLLRGINLMIDIIRSSGIIRQTKTTTTSGSKKGIP
jgi:hypothetical protein